MKPDILNRDDINFIIVTFYDKLITDKRISTFFEEIIAKNQLETHLEIITDFWEDILFQTYKYKNNPLQKHLDFNKKITFKEKHFEIWLTHLNETLDSNFEGINANNMKNRAHSIATVMKLKMNSYQK